MRALWMFVPGLVLAAGAVVLGLMPDHSARRIHCDSLRLGNDGKPYPVCPIQVDHRPVEVVLLAAAGVVALLIAGGVAWRRHRDAPLRAVQGR